MEEMKINAREFCIHHGGELITATDGDEIYSIKENGVGLVYMGNESYHMHIKDDRNISSHILVEGVKHLTDAFKLQMQNIVVAVEWYQFSKVKVKSYIIGGFNEF